MHTVAETDIFQRHAAQVWSDADRVTFINWIAVNREAGDLIPGSGGCRKVRWVRGGIGKRGGVRHLFQPRRRPHMVADRVRQGEIRHPAGDLSRQTEA